MTRGDGRTQPTREEKRSEQRVSRLHSTPHSATHSNSATTAANTTRQQATASSETRQGGRWREGRRQALPPAEALASAPLLPSAPPSLWLLPPRLLTLTAVCVAFVVCAQVPLTAARHCPLPPPPGPARSLRPPLPCCAPPRLQPPPSLPPHIQATPSSMSDQGKNTSANAVESKESRLEKCRGAASGSMRRQLEPAAATAQSTASRHSDAPVSSSSERGSFQHERTAVTQASGATGEVAAWGASSSSSQPVLSSGGNDQPPAALSDLAPRTPGSRPKIASNMQKCEPATSSGELAMKPQPASSASALVSSESKLLLLTLAFFFSPLLLHSSARSLRHSGALEAHV